MKTLDDYGFRHPLNSYKEYRDASYYDVEVKTMSEEKTKNVPIETFRSGGIAVSIWKNITKIDGVDRKTYSFTIEKSRKVGDEWKSSKTFFKNDLLNLIGILWKVANFYVFPPTNEEKE